MVLLSIVVKLGFQINLPHYENKCSRFAGSFLGCYYAIHFLLAGPGQATYGKNIRYPRSEVMGGSMALSSPHKYSTLATQAAIDVFKTWRYVVDAMPQRPRCALFVVEIFT